MFKISFSIGGLTFAFAVIGTAPMRDVTPRPSAIQLHGAATHLYAVESAR